MPHDSFHGDDSFCEKMIVGEPKNTRDISLHIQNGSANRVNVGCEMECFQLSFVFIIIFVSLHNNDDDFGRNQIITAPHWHVLNV